ncbi:NADH-quinone oxidoreductase subunit N [Alistipes sp. ZOR0009]|jgi:NADH-quinone oxidoreductase subunit N|uniref:NADH-quinone oxidoreductase subunit N n=1 Tax=Alistipes sp. ZOR0009 TaxID=1339253 RepID=UPI000648D425|nr:NADH-quinone oxidoreductase subunit N [Alistipes sp. ZOR0009]
MLLQYFTLMRFEWIMSLIIIALFIFNLSGFDKKEKCFLNTVNWLLGINFVAGFIPMISGTLFTGFFNTTPLIVFEKNILNLGLLLISLASRSWLLTLGKRTEFYILMLSSILGMFVMLSSGHILPLYIGLELSTIPIAALAAIQINSKASSEAGIKLIMSSAFSTGITLFGISLLYGAVGSLSFENIIANIHVTPLLLFAFVLILSGFAFKMSIVPFHLWTADVYEGAPTPVTNYLSVLSKGAVVFIFITVLYRVFGSLRDEWLYAISILSALSMTVGNLFAMRQTNLKRFLAFSSITQVGFILVGIAGASQTGIDTAVYFIIIYLFSNIALFGIIGAIADKTGKEDIESYRGLFKTNPFYTLIFAIALFSLAGVPPTAGFFGKLFLLTSGLGSKVYILLGIATLNLVLSLYNYLRIVRAIAISQPGEETVPTVKGSLATNAVLIICVIALIGLGFVGSLYGFIDKISSAL